MTPRTFTLLTIVMLAMGGTPAVAQVVQTSPCPYVTCAVRHTTGLFGERLVRGEASDEVLRINFTGSNAADFLGRAESAAGPARDFRARRTRSAVLGILGGIAAAYAFVEAYDTGDSNFEADPSSAAYAALFGSLVFGVWGGIEATRSRNSLSRAIWEFNRAPVP